MKVSEKKLSTLEKIGRIFRGKTKIPEGMDFCDNCGRTFPKEDMHNVIGFFGSNQELVLCEECSDLPPSSWRQNFSHKKSSKY